VHRFIHTDDAGRTIPDTDYAELTLAMRLGQDPRAVFDALHSRGQIRLYPDAAARLETLAALATASYAEEGAVAVVVDTREQGAELNAAIRDRLVAEGRVDDGQAVATRSGQRISAGDRIATRRNDPALGVANRDTWTVTAVGPHGSLAVTPARAAASTVTPTGVSPAGSEERVLPADYVASHVELAYASTAHGVQGDTVAAAHVVVGEHTGGAAAYVGMTRGRTANVAHLVADDLDDARKQWITVFARDRADLGPGHAAELAATEAARYVPPRPLDVVLAELHAAWTAEQRCRDRLSLLEPMRKELRELIALQPHSVDQLAGLTGTHRQAAWAAEQATHRVEASDAAVAAEADRLRDVLLRRLDGERAAVLAAARVVLDGPGRLGRRRGAVVRAGEQLADWADRWRSHLPQLPADPGPLARVADRIDHRPALWAALDASARRIADAPIPSTLCCARPPTPPSTPASRPGRCWPRLAASTANGSPASEPWPGPPILSSGWPTPSATSPPRRTS
jgi:exodeoxyribonuclease V alpha subunit